MVLPVERVQIELLSLAIAQLLQSHQLTHRHLRCLYIIVCRRHHLIWNLYKVPNERQIGHTLARGKTEGMVIESWTVASNEISNDGVTPS